MSGKPKGTLDQAAIIAALSPTNLMFSVGDPRRKLAAKASLTCECAVSYHVVEYRTPSGQLRQQAVWDETPPDIMQMCFGRCERCGLPYHTEFSSDET